MWLFYALVSLYIFAATEYLLVSAFLFLLANERTDQTVKNPFGKHVMIGICLAASLLFTGSLYLISELAMLLALPTVAVTYAVLTHLRYRRFCKGIPDYVWLAPLSAETLKKRRTLAIIAAISAPFLVVLFALPFYFALIYM